MTSPDERTSGGVWCVVVAAGASTRFGTPKQFVDLAGTRVLDRSVAEAACHCDGVVVVVPPGFDTEAETDFDLPDPVGVRLAYGGPTRSDSVRAGLDRVPDEAELVLVHDAARPLASASVYERVIGALRDGAEAVVPVVAISDTVRHREGATVDRESLVAVQTPQGFAASVLRRAHDAGIDATDDATLAELSGAAVVLVDGEKRNLKLTTPIDLLVAHALLDGEGAEDA